jgi:hypothetical protein
LKFGVGLKGEPENRFRMLFCGMGIDHSQDFTRRSVLTLSESASLLFLKASVGPLDKLFEEPGRAVGRIGPEAVPRAPDQAVCPAKDDHVVIDVRRNRPGKT